MTSPGLLLSGHAAEVTCLAASPAGLVASGSRDGTVRLWRPDDGACVQVLQGHAGPVTAIAWLGSDRLASASADATVRLWSTADGSARVLTGHEQMVTGLAPVAGDRLVSGSADGTLRRWRLADGACEAVFGTVLNPDSDTDWVNEVHALVVARDGSLAVTDGGGGAYLRVWDLAAGGDRGLPGRYLHEPRHWLLAADGRCFVRPDAGGGLTLWRLPERAQVGALTGFHPGALDPAGQVLWAPGPDGALRGVTLDGAPEPQVSAVPATALAAVLASWGDGAARGVLARTTEGQLAAVDVPSGRTVRLGPVGPRGAVAVTPSGRWALAADGAQVRGWQLDPAPVRATAST